MYLSLQINKFIVVSLLFISVLSIRPIEVAKQIHSKESSSGDQPPVECALASLLVVNEMQTHPDCKIIVHKENIAIQQRDSLLCPTNLEYNQCESRIRESYSAFVKACENYSTEKSLGVKEKNSVCREVFQHEEA